MTPPPEPYPRMNYRAPASPAPYERLAMNAISNKLTR